MAKMNFDQRGQKVGNQIIAEKIDVINLGAEHSKTEFIAELQKFLTELKSTTQAGSIEKKVAVDVESHINKVISEAEKSKPKEKAIREHLEGAKSLLEGIMSASNLVAALIQAAKIAGSLFL
jgi:Tfp pilus assembly protein PilP